MNIAFTQETATSAEAHRRFAVILPPKIEVGAAINAAAIVIGGLKSEGFAAPISDLVGMPHAAIQWNLVVLQARSLTHIERLLKGLRSSEVSFVVFTASGRALSNSFAEYQQQVSAHTTSLDDVVAIGLFGDDQEVRKLTKAFSVFKG